MSNKGIIIDVGFAADIKDFVNEIETQFKNVDFSESIGLSRSFDKQVKDVRKRLTELKDEIDQTINGKISNDPNKQIQTLNKAVGALTYSFKEMLKVIPSSELGHLTGDLDNISTDMDMLADTCINVATAIHKVSEAADDDIKFVDSKQITELTNLYKEFGKVEKAVENLDKKLKKSGKISYKDEDEVLYDLIAHYNQYKDIQDKIYDVEDDVALSDAERIKQLDKLNQQYLQTSVVIQRLINTYLGFDGAEISKKINFAGMDISLDSVREELEGDFDDILTYVAKRKAEIQNVVYSLGGGDLAGSVDEINDELKKNKLTVPLNISTKSSTLLQNAISIIHDVQSKLTDTPLEIEVKLLSYYRSNKNNKILEQIAGDVNNIGDEDVKKKILTLINDIQQSIDGVGEFSIKIKTEYATNAVRKFVADAKEELNQLSENLAPLEPELVLTEAHKEAFQKQIDEAKGDFKIQVGIMDGEDTIDNNATKKELSYLKLLKEKVEAVEQAVNAKSLAFIDELGVVQDVIPDERDLLNQLYSDLLLIESQIKDISSAFESIPKVFSMEIDPNTFDSIDNLVNSDVLSKLADAKDTITKTLGVQLGNNIEIPEEKKKDLLEDINKLGLELNNIFNTQGMQNWGYEFNQLLDDISQRIKELFGSNVLNDWIQDMQFSDNLMKKNLGNEHLRERAAVISADGKLYGSGTYDQHNSTQFISKTIDELQARGIIPKVGIHSHGSDRVTASSLSNLKKDSNTYSGDLLAWAYQFLNDGIEKQLTLAINDIELFDAKGFFESNSSVDFKSNKIAELINNTCERIQRETNQYFYQFFQQFIEQYGSGTGETLKNSLVKESLRTKGFTDSTSALKHAIQDSIDPTELLRNFYSQLQNKDNGNNLGRILSKAFAASFDKTKVDIGELGYTKEQANAIFRDILEKIINNSKKIIDNAFNLSQFDYDISSGNYRDLGTFNYRQITPRILEEALDGTGYKNNYQDFMKTYTTEEFINQNPLGLSSGTLSDMFNTSALTGFLETLDKIVLGLTDIKNLSSEDFLSKAFNVKIDEDSLTSFIAEINKLIEELQKLPGMISEAFSNINFTTSANEISEVDKKIQILNAQLQETEQQIKNTQEQIDLLNSSKTTNNQNSMPLIETVNSSIDASPSQKEGLKAEQDTLKILEEQLSLLKQKEETLKQQLQLLMEQKQQFNNNDLDDTNIGLKTDAFKTEGSTVDAVIEGEIQKLNDLEQKLGKVTDAVNAKTEAFKAEGQVVGKVIGEEISSLNPLQNLESSYNIFKGFYDNGNLDSEAGANAALSYYTAYKDALLSKTNKKDLQQFTIGKMSDLFTGNYANYKKGVEDLDLSGINSEIAKYQDIINKINQPEVINIVNALTESIRGLLDSGDTSDTTTKLLENLNKVINNLSGKNSAEKIEKITKNLENLKKSIEVLDVSDSGIIKSLSSILEKGDELKALGEVLKATKKQIDAAGKAVNAEDNYNKASEYLQKNEQQINDAVNQQFVGDNVLYQKLEATKEGLVQVIALVKKADETYKKYTLTIDQNGTVQHKAVENNEQKLAKEVKAWELYQKMKENFTGEPNLGYPAQTFTPDSANWDKLTDKISNFGIELKDVIKILRTVDEVGHESFQVFTDLSRITVGMNSQGVLFQKDEVLASKEAIEQYENSIKKLENLLSRSFKGDLLSIEDFVSTLSEAEEIWTKLNKLNGKGLISDEQISKLLRYNEAFRETITSFSIDKISTEGKTPDFLAQLEQAKIQLESVKDVFSKIDLGQAISDDDISQVKLFISQMRELYDTVGDKGNKLAKSSQIDKLLSKIAKNLAKNSAMSSELKIRFEQLAAEMKAFGYNMPADELAKFTARFEQLNRELQESEKTGLSFFDTVIKRVGSMSASLIAQYLSLYDLIRYARQGFETIKEYDTALTEMNKVSDETLSTLKEFQNESFELANTVGTTAQQIQNSTADWMRLGESLEDAKQSAQDANILFNVSEFESIDAATESLVSMSQAFKELGKGEIIDVVNNLGNNFAISTDGLATALQNSASALKTAQNDFYESAALTTAANTVVQDPNKVGAGKLMPEHIVICGYN